jgi:CDP-ribitol ribitolphosphotransferase
MKRTTTLRKVAVRTGFVLGRMLPARRRVLLATSHDQELRGNLAWIRRDLRTRHPDVDVRVITAPARRGRRARLIHELAAGYALARARVVVVDDYFFPLYVVRLRPGTSVIQVWHAAGAFKKFGYSVLDKAFGADESLVAAVNIHSNYTLGLVSAQAIARHYAEAFGQPETLFTGRIGLPRTDLFGDPAQRAAAEARVRAAIPLPEGRKVLLYAPTFRGSSIGKAKDPGLLDVEVLRERLGDSWVVLIKAHPFVRNALEVPAGLEGFAMLAPQDADLNELMLVGDVLVSDYSSAIYEFSLLGRPIVFLAPDEGEYEDERGFYWDFRRHAPGPICQTSAEVADHLASGELDLQRVRRFAAASFDVVDGRATQRLVDRVLLPGLEGRVVTAADLEHAGAAGQPGPVEPPPA